MARTTNPDAVKVTAFFTPDEYRKIKVDCAVLGLSFTDYVIQLREPKAARKKAAK
jgi:hypothetical protein